MKTNFLIVLLTAISLMGYTQDSDTQGDYKTLFGGDQITHGGYGGLSVNYSQIDGEDALLVGARGAWIINHGLAIGVAGYGFANDMKYYKTIDDVYDKYNLAGGYGGLLIEPIIGSKYPVHVSIPILIGAGGVGYIRHNWNNYDPDHEWDDDWNNDNYHDEHYHADDADAFFVLEPGIELELNMVKFVRLAIGGYYRYTSDLELADTDSDVLNGFSGGVTLKFGKF